MNRFDLMSRKSVSEALVTERKMGSPQEKNITKPNVGRECLKLKEKKKKTYAYKVFAAISPFLCPTSLP